MKACLDILGVPAGPPRLPALPLSPKARAKAAKILRRLEGFRKSEKG
jgi:dihydrodipicolinate synthase/N-acetylneuraminate lyase